MDTEIEIQVRIEKNKPLLEILKQEGKFLYEKHQVDEYFTPPDRDFTAVRPVKEWLRLRQAEEKFSLNYKNWHYDKDGKSDFCDEYETEIAAIDQVKSVFRALSFKSLVVVDKQRKSWQYKDWEISVDAVRNLGDFVEIEYKGSASPDPKQVTAEMIQFLKSLGCGQIERNYLGYPFQLMFPDEVQWEKV